MATQPGVLEIASVSLWLLSTVTLQMGSGDCINIFMATQPCNTANGNWGLHQYLHGCSALSNCKWELRIASISLWLLSPVTLQMGTGVCIIFFYGYSALSHCKWELRIASISSWLLSPVTMQMGNRDCINIFMAVQPCNTANGYWGLHQYLYGYSALSHCTWELEIASISSWLLSPVTLQMGTGDCISIFMAAQPCHTANGNWGLHQYLHGYSALSHYKRLPEIASIFLWLLSPATLQMGTGDCISIFVATQHCHTANGYWGLHQYLYGYSALSHCKWELGIASILFMAAQPCNTANGIWGLHQYLYGCSALSHCKWVLGFASFFFMATQPCHTANGNCGLHQYLHGCSAL